MNSDAPIQLSELLDATVRPNGGDARNLHASACLPVKADTPARRPDTLQHVIFLALAIGVVVASLTLGVGQSQKVTIPVLGIPVPSICQFKNFTGVDCPGCGLSRAFIHLAHGDVAGAWRFNPAAGLVFVFVLAQIPLRSVQLWRIFRGEPELDWRRAGNWAIGVLAVALLAQWLVKFAWWVIG